MRVIIAALIAMMGLSACNAPQDTSPSGRTDASPASEPADAGEVVVYSARNEQLVKPLFDRYTEETGVKITYLTDKDAPLLERLKAEGSRTPADILMTVDAGNLWHAAELGLLAPIDSAVLDANIPANLRDPQNRWFGLSVRARTMVYNPDMIDAGELSTYEDLADPRWKGKLCLRTSKKVYNQSLVATMMAAIGEERTENVVTGWVENLAVPPFASDNEVIEAVAAGRCAVGITNTYYFGRLERSKPDLNAALFWANQGDGERGTHVNVSGAGVTAHAKHPQAAQALIEWLSAGEAQAMFAGSNLEFPANPNVASAPETDAWGSFRHDLINVSEAGALQAEAVKLMDRVGYR